MSGIKDVAAGGLAVSSSANHQSDATVQHATFIICNKLGLHARASAKLVACISNFDCDIHLDKDGITVNGKSILGVMMLAAAKGTELSVRASGPDACRALSAIGALIEDRFGEGE